MDKYSVKMMPKAYRDIDEIYDYIMSELGNVEAALNLATEFENAVLSLASMPFRGAERKVGAFANRGYRQLFVKRFTVIYRIIMYPIRWTHKTKGFRVFEPLG